MEEKASVNCRLIAGDLQKKSVPRKPNHQIISQTASVLRIENANGDITKNSIIVFVVKVRTVGE